MWLLKICILHNVIFEMENFRNGIGSIHCMYYVII